MTEHAYPSPPSTRNHEGNERRVGVEIEFASLDGPTIADAVHSCFGGRIEWQTEFEAIVHTADLGPFKIELDSRWVKEQGQKLSSENGPADPLAEQAAELLGSAAQKLVPWEVVSPPIAISELHRLDRMVAELHKLGALGTQHSALYAFGVHFNPELPELNAAGITAYLQSYVCLHDWLTEHGNVDIARRVTPYINNFGRQYVRLLIDDAYQPDWDSLIDDYLTHNPTRNRSLDMLPLFAFLDEGRVRAVIDDPRIKARPTLHYRLPNCDIDQSRWRLEQPWRDWLQVEHLAADEKRLDGIRGEYRENLERVLSGVDNKWAARAESWLIDL